MTASSLFGKRPVPLDGDTRRVDDDSDESSLMMNVQTYKLTRKLYIPVPHKRARPHSL